MKRITFLLAVLLLTFCGKGPSDVRVGEVLPQWKEGWLDIHSINSGRGESFFYILPDGTTMLVDAAGDIANELMGENQKKKGKKEGIIAKPSPYMSCGKVIGDYIAHYLPAVADGKLDYMMISHYHGDHYGVLTQDPEKVGMVHNEEGNFWEASVTEVGARFPVGMVIDRGDPALRPSEAAARPAAKERYADYLRYIDWSSRKFGTVRQTFAVGRDDQVVLRHEGGKYDCSLFGLAGGGRFWNGTQVDSTWFPDRETLWSLLESETGDSDEKVSENIFSLAFVLRYGPFDWFSAGDLMYKRRNKIPWMDAEAPVAAVVSEVDAMKMCHHSTSEAGSPELLGKLHPKVAVAGIRHNIQPDAETVKRLKAASPDVDYFCTNLLPERDSALRKKGVNPDEFAAKEGHIVLRVEPGGERYWVFVLEDHDQSYTVNAIFGPYQSKP